MRIYNSDEKNLINKIEIILTKEEAEDFYFRLNDLANNPNYKESLMRDDLVVGNVIQKENGTNWINKVIYIYIYSKYNLKNFSKWAIKIITEEKI